MPLRMIDWRCQGKCGRRWEELTSVTASGTAIQARCCGVYAARLIAAPAIRTNDNMPREFRTRTTAGHIAAGATFDPRKRDVISSQLGVPVASREEHDRIVRERGLEMVTASEYSQRYLSYEPPPPRLEDDPQLLRETVEDASDMYDRWQAGALPQTETPMLDEARAEHEAAVDGQVNDGALDAVVDDEG